MYICGGDSEKRTGGEDQGPLQSCKPSADLIVESTNGYVECRDRSYLCYRRHRFYHKDHDTAPEEALECRS